MVFSFYNNLTDNNRLEQNKIVIDDKFTIVNELNPVHHCFNAFQRDSKCDFALCNECKVLHENEEFQGTVKRTRSVYRASHDPQDSNDINAIKKAITNRYQNCRPCLMDEVDIDCDHRLQNLKFTVDKTIFEHSFLEQVKKMKRKYPTHCSKCNVEFRNK